MQACATPTAPAATEYRPESSAVIAILKPSPISPRRFASGTRTSSRMSSLESDERRPSVPWSAWLPYGCRSRSRTNAVMPLASFEGSPCANTSASFDTEPLEIHIFRPRSTHESPSRFALVRSFVASLPTSGSVRPKQPMTSPLHSEGSHRCFCSSVPNLRMVISTSEIWTESVVRTDESARPTSSVTSACETKSRPMPPYFSGTGPPSRPSGAIFPSTSLGKTSPRSRSRAPGAISLSAKSFASLRMDCCSEVRSKSTRLLGRRALRGAFADREQRVDLADVPEAALEDAGRAAHSLRGRLVVRKGSEMLRERANDRVEIPNQLRRVETGDREHLLERVPGQRTKPVVAYTARVVAGPLGPTIGEPSLRRGLRPAEDAGEHV